MTRNFIALVPLAALLSCQSPQADTTLQTENEQVTVTADTASTWIPLFDGKTTNGWHSYGQATAGRAWKVEEGALHLDASNKKDWHTSDGGDLVTDQAYEDFHLKLEWKIAPAGNSGVIFYIHEDTAQYKQSWNTGMEMQIVDNQAHADAKIPKHRAGDLYDLIAANPETVKPAGEWNQVEIRSEGGQLDLFLNGSKVVSTTLWNATWKEMLAGSKFASMPGFGTFKSGKIALQDHGDDVWFRNIMIKKL